MKKLTCVFGIFLALVLVLSACQETALDENVTQEELKKANVKLTGFDDWGFNWNAQQFNGYLINMMLGDSYFEGWPHYKQHVYNGEGSEFWNMLVANYDYWIYMMPPELLDTRLNAHWNSGLIRKDGVYPETWVNSNGWIVFKYSGEVDGQYWSHMRKLVSSRSSDTLSGGIWYNSEGKEIGFESMYWPELIVIQVVNEGEIPPFFYDEYNSPWGPGYGKYKN
ncbi:hypothetical protein [Mangrovibacterium diazotrophicum]|uniref:Uncharacterized protein n=1 Tax=Mangrovibacterium diazotrophicum TaxID=1261403 RepID=A0A419W901_9BACT|nr:hypothetical protein [Mangrovibacterium diazotrophicum]RKD91872.1 hypothetical protein BC643_2240 [Mangrovibacterium diazotrophicum]